MNNPADFIKVAIIIGIVVVLGFFLFPDMHTQIKALDTSEFNLIAAGVVALLPYAFIAAMFIGFAWLWHGRGGQ